MRKYKVCNEEVYLATGQELKQLAAGKIRIGSVATEGNIALLRWSGDSVLDRIPEDERESVDVLRVIKQVVEALLDEGYSMRIIGDTITELVDRERRRGK